MQTYYTYIIYSERNKFHSLGVTADLKNRWEILKKNNEKIKLVYWEVFDRSNEATARENILKQFPAEILNQLVKENNPTLADLSNL